MISCRLAAGFLRIRSQIHAELRFLSVCDVTRCNSRTQSPYTNRRSQECRRRFHISPSVRLINSFCSARQCHAISADALDGCKNCGDVLQWINNQLSTTPKNAAQAFRKLVTIYSHKASKTEIMNSSFFEELGEILMSWDVTLNSETIRLALEGATFADKQHQLVSYFCDMAEKTLSNTTKLINVRDICNMCSLVNAIHGTVPLSLLMISLEIIMSRFDTWEISDAIQVFEFLRLSNVPGKSEILLRTSDYIADNASALSMSEVCQVVHHLKLHDYENITCLLALSKQSAKFVSTFSDRELSLILQTLKHFQICTIHLLKALEYEIPRRMWNTIECETLMNTMQYFGSSRFLSQPLFDEVSKYFVEYAEKFTTHQIAQILLPFGQLYYIPSNASEVFDKIEETFNYRWHDFQPLDVLDLLYSCVLLARLPLNFTHKMLSSHFLEKFENSVGVDVEVRSKLSQIVLAMSLEQKSYHLPKLPHKYKVKYLHHTMEIRPYFLVRQLKAGLCELLGGDDNYEFWVQTPYIYHIDIQIKLDKEGFVLSKDTEDTAAHSIIAICLNELDHHCLNYHHLLGIEVIKQRHLTLLGYQVIQIPYYEIQGMKSSKQWHEYLHKKIFPRSPRLQW
ncbi:FAST kinase domain-containing protein 3, mitochondrial-like [Saccoglossus kowalevskii]|uniref:FAST kinase domain-containing protein 3-like n=1 Tax=Saccoglossus kowalevskii TaxID=10224 RepID=A0ABM0MZT8_SACKO|nr:PREDICTED: FAST kinase domain-containing protein 3-like [Saccoglossus kowalevskii]